VRVQRQWHVHGQPRRVFSDRHEHADAASLGSRQWICCVLDFKSRRREFFLDEPTAFAAGHRPCSECRRKDAEAFAEKWCEARPLRSPPYAAEMNNVLHAERLRGRAKRLHRRKIDELPDGGFPPHERCTLRGDRTLNWNALTSVRISL
jgi:hypothetical protein